MPAVDAILARLMALHPRRIDLSLDRMWRILGALGHPERKLPPVIHVAGTNGKGSTVATLRACLEAAGYRVHTYTSPHLVRFHERIRLGGRMIEEDALLALLEECERVNCGAPIMCFVVAFTGQCKDSTSACSSRSSKCTRPAGTCARGVPSRAANTARMPKLSPSRATAWPSVPEPTSPSVRPASSRVG